jgi:hypothetical protein
VRKAAEVGQFDDAALLGRKRLESVADVARLISARRLDVGALGRREALLDALVASPPPIERRSASMARLWTMPSTHVRTDPRVRS